MQLFVSPYAHYIKMISHSKMTGRGWHQYLYVHNLIMTARRRSKFICPLRWIILIQRCAKLTFCVAKFINLSLGKVRNIFPFFCFLSGHRDNIHQLQQPLRDWNCRWGQTLAFIFLSSLLTQPSNHTLLTIAASQVLVSKPLIVNFKPTCQQFVSLQEPRADSLQCLYIS